MQTKVNPIPTGYEAVTPYLIIRGASQAIDFYKKAFGATELMRIGGPDGKIGHAEIRIGKGILMISDEAPQMGHKSPQSFGGTPVGLAFYSEDVDALVKRATAAGAKVTQPVENKFYGDRAAGLTDPFGFTWYVATHVEDVPPEEMQKRAAAMHKEGGCA